MKSNKNSTHYYYFFISGDIFQYFLPEFTSEFTNFVQTRLWRIEPPGLFENENQSENDYIIGGELKIFDAWREKIEKKDDTENYYDVKSIVDFLSEYSYRYSADVAFQIESTEVGTISSGVLSRDLAETLLEEWKKSLQLQ